MTYPPSTTTNRSYWHAEPPIKTSLPEKPPNYRWDITVSAPLIGFILWAVAPATWFLTIALIPLAVGGGVLGVVNRSLLSKSVKPEEIGEALGLSTSLESMNGIIAPALGGLLVSSVGQWAPGAAAALILSWVTFFIWRKIVRPGLFSEVPKAEQVPV